MNNLFNGKQVIVSRSGTIHVESAHTPKWHAGRISTICDLGINPKDGPFPIGTRDCDLCVDLLRVGEFPTPVGHYPK
jgi:hypothetical protein